MKHIRVSIDGVPYSQNKARGNKPAAKLVPIISAEAKQHAIRKPGGWEHLIGTIPDGFFFEALPDDELKLWEGED